MYITPKIWKLRIQCTELKKVNKPKRACKYVSSPLESKKKEILVCGGRKGPLCEREQGDEGRMMDSYFGVGVNTNVALRRTDIMNGKR